MKKVWEDQGPPVHIAVAGYLGLLKTSKKKPRKRAGFPDKPNSNPFAVHDEKPAVGTKPQGDDLNELARMFAGNGGMIQ